MRLVFLFSLLLATVLGSSYVYFSTLAVCVTPIQYRIGQFDEQFGITTDDALAALEQSEAVWEGLTNRELFVYAPTADFTINFVFDDRQATAVEQVQTADLLDTVEQQNEKINAQFATLEAQFVAARTQYEARVVQYNQAQDALNARIAAYNQAGEYSAEEEAAISSTQAQLDVQAQRLNAEADSLNKRLEEINQLADKGNSLIDIYNQNVQSFNDQFGESREFTQGDYQGDSINIYTFLDEAELVRVLVHEFGHALGIGHVENSESMMYHLMSNQPTIARLSAEDTEAFFATCGQDTDLKNRLITAITQFIQ